jgi:hypothetical protein
VANIWGKHVNSIDPTNTINIKLKRVNFFKVWGANVFGNNRELKQELKLELETLELLEEQN